MAAAAVRASRRPASHVRRGHRVVRRVGPPRGHQRTVVRTLCPPLRASLAHLRHAPTLRASPPQSRFCYTQRVRRTTSARTPRAHAAATQGACPSRARQPNGPIRTAGSSSAAPAAPRVAAPRARAGLSVSFGRAGSGGPDRGWCGMLQTCARLTCGAPTALAAPARRSARPRAAQGCHAHWLGVARAAHPSVPTAAACGVRSTTRAHVTLLPHGTGPSPALLCARRAPSAIRVPRRR